MPASLTLTPFPAPQLGDMAQFQARPFVAFPGTAQLFGILGIGSPPSPPLELGKFTLSNRRFVDVRFDWHTSGDRPPGRIHSGTLRSDRPTAVVSCAEVRSASRPAGHSESGWSDKVSAGEDP
jgi:hypothetical protein